MATFPLLSDAVRLDRLTHPAGIVDLVLDTDTFNEIDDQFALVYAMGSGDRIRMRAILAAPFQSDRAATPRDGMEQSRAEILRLLDRLKVSPDDLVFDGSTRWLGDRDRPVDSPAARRLIALAMEDRDGPLYVAGIAAITNVASAILIEPRIIDRIVVLWLGGQPTRWHEQREFNLQQDVAAAQVLFDCGVPLVLFPCRNVAEHLRTTLWEIERFVKGRGAIGDYLHEVYSGCATDHFAYSRVIWDLAPIAWLNNSRHIETVLTHSPILTPDLHSVIDPHRHLIREAIGVNRDAIFADLFRLLAARAV